MALFNKKNRKNRPENDNQPAINAVYETEAKGHKGLTKEIQGKKAQINDAVAGELKAAGESDKKSGLFEKFKKGLSKTRSNFSGRINSLIQSNKKLDEDFWEELEEILIQADVGITTTLELVEKVRQATRKERITESSEITAIIAREVSSMLQFSEAALNIGFNQDLSIIMFVGVNGAGKTTSIAKLAYKLKDEGKKVIVAAADTFRAAAIDQLQVWTDRVGVELIKHQEGSDPGAVVFDAINAAKARKADTLIIDTAGRLQNKNNLMREISKIRKIIEREIPEGPQEVLLVLDATTGQNAISQSRIFEEAVGVTGIVLTKLDGTAKGGIVLAIARELNIPVKLVGVGEGLDDMKAFDSDIFARALFAE